VWTHSATLAGTTENRLACQADLFGIITAAAGEEELRDGASIMSQLRGGADTEDSGAGAAREYFFGVYSEPGSAQFKVMVRSHSFKYIFVRTQLHNTAILALD
jgi:choline-sulfatase